jgi:hypothetical protein
MTREYRPRFKCPYCQKPYAKPKLWTAHIAKCAANPGIPVTADAGSLAGRILRLDDE